MSLWRRHFFPLVSPLPRPLIAFFEYKPFRADLDFRLVDVNKHAVTLRHGGRKLQKAY